MELRIRNRIITSSIMDILNLLKKDCPKQCFKDIIDKRDNIVVTCPNIMHSGGNESHPSCNIFNRRDDPKIPYGWVRCFSCGYSKSLPGMIGELFDSDETFGETWLIQNAESSFIEEEEYLEPIEISSRKSYSAGLSEDILHKYQYYHPYMWDRKLSQEVVDKFQVGFDYGTQCLTFPVRDLKDNLVMITRRSIKSKNFYIPSDVVKPVYLLNEIVKAGYKIAMVTEAQIDALTAYTYGFPCCATMGSISDHQIDILNHCGITNFIAAFDNDRAGKAFTQNFIRRMRKDILITEFPIPKGYKDLNDLDKGTFNKILNDLGITQRI